MKKIAVLVLFVIVTIVIVSCGNGEVTSQDMTTDPTVTTTDPVVTTTDPVVTTTEPDQDAVEPPQTYSEGLIYRLNNEKTGYMVVGIGNCVDTDIVLPEKYQDLPVLEIVDEAFSGCKTVYTITIPDTVTKIGYSAFKGCSKLESVVIGCGVKRIGNEAFESCGSLTSIIIPDTVTKIGYRAFYNCTKLADITLPFVGGDRNNGGWGGLQPLTNSSLQLAGADTDEISQAHFGYIFGASSYLENGSFVPVSLKTVVITGGESIGEGAFYDCNNLASIILPDDITDIGDRAFWNCRSLMSVVVPDKVVAIGGYAFGNCVKLTSVVLSNSSVDVGAFAFSGCGSLVYNVYDKGRYLGNEQNPYAILIGATSVTITSITVAPETESIYYGALSDCSKLNSITLPFVGKTNDGKSNTHFGYLFGTSSYEDNVDCVPASLKTVVITGSTRIDDYAFYGCNKLTNVTLPDGLKSIGAKTFWECSSLTGIMIPNSVTSIGTLAFRGCKSLSVVDITDIAKWCEITFDGHEANPLYNAKKLYLNGTLVTDLVIPDGVKHIGDYAFSFYYQLTSVTIPDSVLTIGKGAFWYCTGLANVTIGKGTTSIGDAAFRYCLRLTEITIPNSVQSLGARAFDLCENLASVTIPKSVTNIGENAFSGCTDLESVYITDIEAWCLIAFENDYANPLSYADQLYLNGVLVTAFPKS